MLIRRRSNNLFINRAKGKFDWILFGCMFFLIIFGLMAIANATADPYEQVEGSGFFAEFQRLFTYSTRLQLTWAGIGLAVFLVVFLLFDYRIYGEFALVIYIAANLILAVVLFLPRVAGINAFVQWSENRTFQPSEICKVAIIITLAKHLSMRTEKITSLKEFLPYFIHVAIPFGIVILQKDTGSALVYLAIFFGMIFMAGISWQLLVGIGLTGALAAISAWPFLAGYQQDRILDFLDQTRNLSSSGHHVYYSKIAVGSGQLAGKGLFVEGNISQLNFVPIKHTDFIFAVTAESVGFIGCLLILAVYFIFLCRLFQQSYKTTDRFGSLIIAGVGSMLLFHVIINVGMTIGIMPVTGIPLPFLSYGGSSLLANMMAMGLVFNVLRNQQRTLL